MPSLAEIAHRFLGRRTEPSLISSSPVESPVPVPLESLAPASQPEIINEEVHPLRLYPGFDEYVEGWNSHATSASRLGLQLDIQSVQLEVDRLPNQAGLLQLEVERLRLEQQRQQEIFDAKRDLTKKERNDPLKRANRSLRKAREDLERVTHAEQRIKRATEARLEAGKGALANLDEEFAFGLDESDVKFYIAERLRDDQYAIDTFLLRYCTRKKLSGFRLELTLDAINYSLFSLLTKYYSNTADEVNSEELRLSANEARNRQLRLAGIDRRDYFS